jgi:hypothetical protein
MGSFRKSFGRNITGYQLQHANNQKKKSQFIYRNVLDGGKFEPQYSQRLTILNII